MIQTSHKRSSAPFIFTRDPEAVPEYWTVTDKRTRQPIGYIRKSVEQTAVYEARRPQDVAFASPFASRVEAARWMRDSKTGPIREGDRV